MRTRAFIAGAACGVIVMTACAPQPSSSANAASSNNFKLVDAPGGGHYIYGQLPGRGSLPDAIVYMLQQAHTYYGNRPEVGKFFRSRDGRSVAAFYSVKARNANDKMMTGLLIVNRTADGSASGAVVFDEQSRFARTEPALLKSLSTVWSPASGSAPTASAKGAVPSNGGASAAPLTQSTGGDNSASIGLPTGWKIDQVLGGSITAEGPNGERVFLGLLYQGIPVGPNLFASFTNAANHYRSSRGLPQGVYSVTNQTRLGPRAIQVLYTVDFHDGIGPRRGSVRLDVWGPGALGVNGSFLPERIADSENATMLAVIHSYRPNAQVVGRLQQGALDRVHADAARAAAQSAAINARREASNAAFDQHMNALNSQSQSFDSHMDDIDRSSKMTQDYILDRSVVRDTENGDRGTVTNGYADYLLKTQPNRFEAVPNQDLIKGRDY